MKHFNPILSKYMFNRLNAQKIYFADLVHIMFASTSRTWHNKRYMPTSSVITPSYIYLGY